MPAETQTAEWIARGKWHEAIEKCRPEGAFAPVEEQQTMSLTGDDWHQFLPEAEAALKEADRRAREDAASICDAMCDANDKAHRAPRRTWGSGVMSGRSAGFRDAALAIRASITTDEGEAT